MDLVAMWILDRNLRTWDAQSWLAAGTWAYALGTCALSAAAIIGISAWRSQLRTNYRLSLLRRYRAATWKCVRAIDLASYYLPLSPSSEIAKTNYTILTTVLRAQCHKVWTAFLEYEFAHASAIATWVPKWCTELGEAFRAQAQAIADNYQQLYHAILATPDVGASLFSVDPGKEVLNMLKNDTRGTDSIGTAGAMHDAMSVLVDAIESEIEKLMA